MQTLDSQGTRRLRSFKSVQPGWSVGNLELFLGKAWCMATGKWNMLS